MGIYMTPDMKVCFTVRKFLFTIVFIMGEMKQSFCFDLFIYDFCFDEIIASAVFGGSVYVTHISRNEILFLPI